MNKWVLVGEARSSLRGGDQTRSGFSKASLAELNRNKSVWLRLCAALEDGWSMGGKGRMAGH